jgi:hypothetical protein
MLTREQLITGLEEHATALLQRLTEYRRIEDDLKRTQRALQHMKSETSAPGRPVLERNHQNGSHPAKESETKRKAIVELLTKHPEGLTKRQMEKLLGRKDLKGSALSWSLSAIVRDMGLIRFKKSPGGRLSDGVWELATAKLAKQQGASPRKGKKEAPITAIAILQKIAELDQPVRPSEVADALQYETSRKRSDVAIRMSEIYHRGFVSRKSGMYTMTAAGQKQLADNAVNS